MAGLTPEQIRKRREWAKKSRSLYNTKDFDPIINGTNWGPYQEKVY